MAFPYDSPGLAFSTIRGRPRLRRRPVWPSVAFEPRGQQVEFLIDGRQLRTFAVIDHGFAAREQEGQPPPRPECQAQICPAPSAFGLWLLPGSANGAEERRFVRRTTGHRIRYRPTRRIIDRFLPWLRRPGLLSAGRSVTRSLSHPRRPVRRPIDPPAAAAWQPQESDQQVIRQTVSHLRPVGGNLGRHVGLVTANGSRYPPAEAMT